MSRALLLLHSLLPMERSVGGPLRRSRSAAPASAARVARAAARAAVATAAAAAAADAAAAAIAAAAAAAPVAEPSRRVRPTERRSPRASLPASERNAATRVVHCCDAVQWLAAQPSLPSVITSLPDITELQGPPLFMEAVPTYRAWFRSTVATIVAKLRPGSVAIFYQTDATREGEYIDKAVLCALGASDAGGAALWHKVVLRQDVGTVRFGKLPAFTHLVAFASPAGGLVRARTGACGVPDVFHRGSMAWSKAMGVDAAVWCCRFLRNDIGDTEVCDPFCGSGTVLAAANHFGLSATGVDLSPKRARHAMALRLYKDEDGMLLARRDTDRQPPGELASDTASAAADEESDDAAEEAATSC